MSFLAILIFYFKRKGESQTYDELEKTFKKFSEGFEVTAQIQNFTLRKLKNLLKITVVYKKKSETQVSE